MFECKRCRFIGMRFEGSYKVLPYMYLQVAAKTYLRHAYDSTWHVVQEVARFGKLFITCVIRSYPKSGGVMRSSFTSPRTAIECSTTRILRTRSGLFVR